MSFLKIENFEFEPYIPASDIEKRVNIVSIELQEKEAETNPVFLVIMTGAFIFAADLLRQVTIGCEVRFVRVKSYAGTTSTGTFRIEEDYLGQLSGRNIIIVEDIVDTGRTIKRIKEILEKEEVASIKICSLLSKPEAHEIEMTIDYLCFEIPNEFVVGYGLDYNDKGRNLPDIWKVKF